MKEPIITARTIWTLVILLIIAFLLGMVVYNPRAPLAEVPTVPQGNQEITVVGTMTCLPHKDTTGPTTLECAYGITSTDGLNYALDLAGTRDQADSISFDDQISISGTFVPVEALSNDQWQKYDIVGIIQVNSIIQE